MDGEVNDPNKNTTRYLWTERELNGWNKNNPKLMDGSRVKCSAQK